MFSLVSLRIRPRFAADADVNMGEDAVRIGRTPEMLLGTSLQMSLHLSEQEIREAVRRIGDDFQQLNRFHIYFPAMSVLVWARASEVRHGIPRP